MSCFKLNTGLTVPCGKCFMCGGELELLPDRDVRDVMRFHAMHDAVQFALSTFHFYRQALEKTTGPEQRIVIERLYEAALDALHELQEKYHARVEREMVELACDEEKLQAEALFQGVKVEGDAPIADLYQSALEIERRERQHLYELESECPAGVESEVCRELVAEEDEHIAALETELEQLQPTTTG